MTFLQPWAAWFLAGIPVIVLLYMLRLKRREITVSTHLFWQRVLQESSRRAFFHRLRHLLSLLLHILIFLLIAAALARPLWKPAAEVASNTVIVLDTRARMQAVEPDGQTRFAKAASAAREYFRNANTRANICLITTDHSARIAVPFTDDEKTLRDSLERVSATDASGKLEDGIELAKAVLAGRPGHGRVVVFTDRAAAAAQKPNGPDVAVRAFGSSRDNSAISQFAIRPLPANRETAEVLIEARNFGQATVRSEIEIALDGRPFDVRPIELAPGQAWNETFTSVPRPMRGSRGWLTAKLKAVDSLHSDNIAYASHPARSPRRVLLVSAGNPFLEKLLAVDPATKFQLIQPHAWQPALAEKFEVVVFDRAIPAGYSWQSAPGNFFFIGANPFGAPAAPLERPLVTEISADDPLTRNVALRNVAIEQAQPIIPPSPTPGWSFRAPIKSFEHSLLVAGNDATRRIAVLGFDLLQSDLPLRVAFPLMISNTLQWLDQREVDIPLALKTGEALPLKAGQKIAPLPLTAPPKTAPQLVSAPLLQPLHNGFYLLADGDEQRWVAANTFNVEESNLQQPAAAQPVEQSGNLPAIGVGPWPLWTWLTLAALALFTGEWWLFHRRKTE